MQREFVPYELAVKLKELGFDEECFGYYVDGELDLKWRFIDAVQFGYRESVLAPLWQQAFDWFTRKGLHSYIEGAYPWFRYYINTADDRYEGFKHLKIEETREACLLKLIELCEKN